MKPEPEPEYVRGLCPYCADTRRIPAASGDTTSVLCGWCGQSNTKREWVTRSDDERARMGFQ